MMEISEISRMEDIRVKAQQLLDAIYPNERYKLAVTIEFNPHNREEEEHE